MDNREVKILEIQTILTELAVQMVRWSRKDLKLPDSEARNLIRNCAVSIYDKIEEGEFDV